MTNFQGTDEIPPALRLALSYSPARVRPAWQAFLRLDTRLATLAARAREPMIAQLRLAWWRERLGELGPGRPAAEPLLREIGQLGMAGGAFVPLVDGWEAMLPGEGDVQQSVEALTAGRHETAAALFGPAADLNQACRLWSLGEHAPAKVGEGGPTAMRLAPELRPLQILAQLGARALAAGRRDLLASPVDMLAAMRIGLLGR